MVTNATATVGGSACSTSELILKLACSTDTNNCIDIISSPQVTLPCSGIASTTTGEDLITFSGTTVSTSIVQDTCDTVCGADIDIDEAGRCTYELGIGLTSDI